MTPRERAGTIIDSFWLDWCVPDASDRMPVTIDRLMLAIEQAIIAAIEQEREECAKIIEERADDVWWLSNLANEIRDRRLAAQADSPKPTK